MQFRTRSAYGPRVASVAPLLMDLPPDREFHEGEVVTLYAEAFDPQGMIQAKVVGVTGRRIRVRIVDAAFTAAGECLFAAGTEFMVRQENVFAVRFSA